MGQTFNRQGIYLVNSLEALIRQVIKENERGESSNKGPILGSYKGEESLFQHQPKRNQAPPPPSKVQYLLYPVEGGMSEGQVYDQPPRIIPEGFKCEVQLVPVAETE
jgi:hypothetical protein